MSKIDRRLPEASPTTSPNATAASPLLGGDPGDVFEGPEKKLEVFFTLPTSAEGAVGFRAAPQAAWSDVLTAASCTILHQQANDHSDAYLLSESSLFVYPHKVILKTCGSTTLLLTLPKLLALADSIGADLEHVHYSHYEYKFPHLQPYPHSSYDEERDTLVALLGTRIAGVTARVLGEAGSNTGACWYALCTEAHAPSVEPTRCDPALAMATVPATLVPVPGVATRAPPASEVVIEVAMEGLSPSVCALYHGDHPDHGNALGKALARSMSSLAGVGALVEGTLLDDWAFEPCGYSMNAQREEHYYTVHVTPESAFSYASFETTDPSFASPHAIRDIIDAFQPSRVTVTLTTRAQSFPATLQDFDLGMLDLDGYSAAVRDDALLSQHVAVASSTYLRHPSLPAAPMTTQTIATAAIASPVKVDGSKATSWSAVSLADSESTAPNDLDDVTQEEDIQTEEVATLADGTDTSGDGSADADTSDEDGERGAGSTWATKRAVKRAKRIAIGKKEAQRGALQVASCVAEKTAGVE